VRDRRCATLAGLVEGLVRSPPVPAGVGNISFGATLVGNGRMTVDNLGIAIAPRAGGPIAIGIGVSPRTLLGSLLFGLVLAPVIGAVAYDRYDVGGRDSRPCAGRRLWRGTRRPEAPAIRTVCACARFALAWLISVPRYGLIVAV
jgi:hypothetical protein